MRRRFGLVVALLVVVGCDTSSIRTEGRALARAVPDWSSDVGTLAVPRSAAAPVAGPGLGSGKPVTFAIAGDVNFENNPGEVLRTDPTALFTPSVREALRADITMVNLETAVTERGEPVPKTYNFRAPPIAFGALRSVGVDVVSLANNHGMDFGEVGLLDTLAAADDPDTGLPLVGGGHDDAEAYEPFRVTVRGQRISILAGSRITDAHLVEDWTAGPGHPGLAQADDPTRLLEAVRAERARTDTLLVYLHWGQEYNDCPIADQPEIADQLIAAGADVVVGSHAHVPLAGGMHDGSYVAYGLGNFIFGSAHDAGLQSGVLQLTLTGRRVDDAEWLPARISSGIPTMLEGDEAAAALATWEGLRECADVTAGTERTTRGDDGA